MDAETRRRIFEPFFTTKPEGVGSGLGLATVRGIVQRARRRDRPSIRSQGAGTRFRIYLPRVASAASPKRAAAVSGEVPGGRETILLVEDADLVRDVTRELLEGLGYTVLPGIAWRSSARAGPGHPGPDPIVLLTDVVMPQLDGGSLAAEVASVRPQVRVLVHVRLRRAARARGPPRARAVSAQAVHARPSR